MGNRDSGERTERKYFPEIQRYIGRRIKEIVSNHGAEFGVKLSQKVIVDDMNRTADNIKGRVNIYMFSRMRKKGKVSDPHVIKFIQYFDCQKFCPGFSEEVAQERRRLLNARGTPESNNTALEDYLSREGGRNEWLVYEAAFLWHSVSPPPVRTHELFMTPEIYQTKRMIHEAIDSGKIKSSKEIRTPQGVTRYVSEEELKNFSHSISEKPDFLFFNRRHE